MFSCATHLLESTGRSEEADGEILDALSRDPLSGSLNTELGCNAYYRRQYDTAVKVYRDVLSLDPDNVVASWGLGKALCQRKDYEGAIVELNKAVARGGAPAPILVAAIGYAYASLGRKADTARVLQQLDGMSKTIFVDPYLVAAIYLASSDKTHALDLLERAETLKSSFLISIPREPQWDALRDEPRFQTLVRRLGFPA